MSVPRVRNSRPTRDERKRRTRSHLLATARRVFMQRGFHVASLEDIAEEAGYSKGAIYSNFAGKDELFLAVFADHIEERKRSLLGAGLIGTNFEAAVRAVAAAAREQGDRDPAWSPLLIEFWAHASRRDGVREALLELHHEQLDAFAGVIETVAERHGVTFSVPAREVVRGTGALARGLALERLLDPDTSFGDLFEEMFVGATLAVVSREAG